MGRKTRSKKQEDEDSLSSNEWAVLGLCYEQQFRHTQEHYNAIFKCYKKADELGSAIGSLELGKFFRRAYEDEQMLVQNPHHTNNRFLAIKGVPGSDFHDVQIDELLGYFDDCNQRAIDRGSGIALFFKGKKYEEEKNFEEAKKCFDAGAEKGELNCLLEQVKYYEDKKRGNDSVRAKYYLELAAVVGYPSTLRTVAQKYKEGSEGYSKDESRAFYMYRLIAEAEIGHYGQARALWYLYQKQEQANNMPLLYHLAYLLRKKSEESSYTAIANEMKINELDSDVEIGKIRMAFQKAAFQHFDAFDELTHADDWNQVKLIFIDPKKAQEFFDRKQQALVKRIQYLVSVNNQPRDLAIKVLEDYVGTHPSYLVGIEAVMDKEEKREENKPEISDSDVEKDRAVCQQLCKLIDGRLEYLKAKMIERLAFQHFDGDSKLANDYYENHKAQFSKIFNLKEGHSSNSSINKIKNDGELRNLYIQLRECIEPYRFASAGAKPNAKHPAKFLNRLMELLDVMKGRPGKSGASTFFGGSRSNPQREKFFRDADKMLRPFAQEQSKYRPS